MRFTSPSRRALGLLAVSTIGMSTAVLGVAGIASATPAVTDDDSMSASTFDSEAGLTILPGYCWAFIRVTGASGGGQDSSSQVGGDPDSVEFYVTVEGGQVFTFAAGGEGGAENGPGSANGTGGVNTVRPALNGEAGVGGGGGGAGSAILLDGSVLATAAGGHGASPSAGGVGGGTTGIASSAALMTGRTPVIRPAVSWDGGGAVSISVIGCKAPFAPNITSANAGDGIAEVTFAGQEGSDYVAAPSGYEYSINGTRWTTLTSAQVAAGSFTISGLTNGTAYPVTMRSTSAANGPSEVTAASTVTPFVVPGAATITSVRTAPSRVTVTWTAPTTPGTFPVTGYSAGWGRGEMGIEECSLAADARSCSFNVPAGDGYTITVYAVDSQGNFSDAADQAGVTVPGSAAPASVPTKDDGDITGPAGAISTLAAGQKVTLQGSGYAPNSTVQLTVFSSPVSLGTVVTDQNGAFSVEVTIPANLANGTHHLVATGVDINGNARNLVISVTVSGGVATLATTGFDAVPVALGGGLFLLAGAGLVVGARRRSTNA